MSVNALIAQGVAPIGRDVPNILMATNERRQREQQNALLERRLGLSEQREKSDYEEKQADRAQSAEQRRINQSLAQVEWFLATPGITKEQLVANIPEIAQGWEQRNGAGSFAAASIEQLRADAEAARIKLASAAGIRPHEQRGKDPYTLGPGSGRYDPSGQLIAERPFAPPAPPNHTVIVTPDGQQAFNPRTGGLAPLSTREDMRAAEAQDESAKAVARVTAEWGQKKIQELPKLRATTSEMVTLLGQLDSHPGFEWVYGAKSLAPVVPGTPQADAVALWDQVSGKAFLTAFETLKGGGPITDREGEKATAAMTRLANRKQSPASARKALQELIQISEDVLARAEASAGAQQAAPASPGGQRRVRVDAEGNVIGN